MKPDDIIGVNGHRWRVRGVHLGASGTEDLIEIENVSHKPGWTGEWETHQMMFVPEILIRTALTEVRRREHAEEDRDCAHMILDDMKVPREDSGGNRYSLVGRINLAIAKAQSENTARMSAAKDVTPSNPLQEKETGV
jgi:hypothetical protein